MKLSSIHWILLLITSIAIFAACGRSNYPDKVDTGHPLALTDGAPEFSLSAMPGYNESGESFIQVSAEISKSSLIFRTTDGVPKANITVRYTLRPTADRSAEPITALLEETVLGDPERTIQVFEWLRFTEEFKISPGSYSIEAQITDVASNKTHTRTISIDLPDLDDGSGLITSIAMLGWVPELAEPLTIGTYDVQGNADSLSFRYFLSRSAGDEPIYAHMRLQKIESDQSPAVPMYFRGLTSGNIRVRGINYGRTTVLESQSRRFDTEFGAIEVEFSIPTPDIGSYRFEVFTTSGSEANTSNAIIFRARDFGVRTRFFPEIASAREMAEPLVYLMNNSEYSRLMEIEDEDELRMAVDRFWVENIGNANEAREVMTLYYERVVEANKQFSSFKAGWKTDMGMMYILFGPPWYVENFGRNIQWVYGFDRTDRFRVFNFSRTRLGNERFPFNHWTLNRQDFYHSIHYNRKQDWLNGFVLRRPFGGG
ncbi:MAG: GWxTD domain-containing protein [Balneolales bacterium]|nr:GWxTD domain-containing protein [Balneolales bacterium]